MSSTQSDSLLALLNRINSTTPPTPRSVVSTLESLSKREGDLVQNLPDGQDPLVVLTPNVFTLPLLYILIARLNAAIASGAPPALSSQVDLFCRQFDPVQARHAPEQVTKLAEAILKYSQRSPDFAIECLLNLISRYPPSSSYLTTLHSLFLQLCVQHQRFAIALTVLSVPITEIDKSLSNIDYLDNLQYHYLGGIALAALKKYPEAEEYLEIVVSSPVAGQAPSAIQIEAYKKLALIQLIYRGKVVPPPKYTHGAVTRHWKSAAAYQNLVRYYPSSVNALHSHAEREVNTFRTDGNFGLVKLALERAPRWALKNLMNTYISLSISQIAKAVAVESPDAARRLVLAMIEDGSLAATLAPDGTITFLEEDHLAEFSPAAVEAMLRKAQEASLALAQLNTSMSSSRELLSKAVREKENSRWEGGGSMPMSAYDEEEMWGGSRNQVGGLFDD